MNLQFSLDNLTTPAISLSYFSSDEEMDLDGQSVVATGHVSDDSDIEVMTCYRQVPIQLRGAVAGRQTTTELSDCTDGDFPAFPWDDFESIMQMTESQAIDRGAGPTGAGHTDSPPIELTPFVDTRNSSFRT